MARVAELALGGVFGVGLVLLARSRGPRGERTVLAVGLVITALLYVVFALVGGARAPWLMLEVIGVMPFAAFAWLGVRASPMWLTIGWVTPVGWDVGLHLGAAAPTFVPAFFPMFCVSFDLVVGGAIVAKTPRRE